MVKFSISGILGIIILLLLSGCSQGDLAGEAYYGKVKRLPPDDEDTSDGGSDGGGGSGNSYQSILDMLNSCEIIKSSGPPSTYNCDTICGDRGTCVTALFSDWQYDFHGTGDGVIYSEQVECDKDIGINPPDMEALYCTCCSS